MAIETIESKIYNHRLKKSRCREELGDGEGGGAAEGLGFGSHHFCELVGGAGLVVVAPGHPVEPDVLRRQDERFLRPQHLPREQGDLQRHHHRDGAALSVHRLVQETDAVLLVVDGRAVVEPLYAPEVHPVPDAVLPRGQLDVLAVQLHLHPQHRTLEGQTTVDADHLGERVLAGVDAVEAGGGVDVVGGVIAEEVDVVRKTPLDAKLLDGLLNGVQVVGLVGKDVDHDGVGVGGGFQADYGQYFLELGDRHFLYAP